jgi:hypothetical protein
MAVMSSSLHYSKPISVILQVRQLKTNLILERDSEGNRHSLDAGISERVVQFHTVVYACVEVWGEDRLGLGVEERRKTERLGDWRGRNRGGRRKQGEDGGGEEPE